MDIIRAVKILKCKVAELFKRVIAIENRLPDFIVRYGDTMEGDLTLQENLIFEDVNFNGVLNTDTLTADRAWLFPNKSGTIAMTSDIISTFIGLSDTPNAYTGSAGYIVTVKSDMSGLEFSDSADIKINETNIIDSTANNILYSDGTKLQQATLGQDLEIVAGVIKTKDTLTSSSNAITFTRETIYGTAASPITTLLTLDNTTARLGLIQKVYYNNAALPSGLSVFQGLAFRPNLLNILYLEWCGGNRYECWIAYEY